MSTTTTNLGLTKPANNENVDLSVINDNYDIIDTFAGTVPSSTDIPSALSELTDDVTISSATDGQVLTYDGTTSKWKNAAGPSSGSTVSWTQKTATGTNIADITINGVTTSVYAPSGGGATYTDVTASIASGSTSVTISDASITTSSMFFPCSDPFGLVITNMVAATGSLTITYQTAASNYTLKVRVW